MPIKIVFQAQNAFDALAHQLGIWPGQPEAFALH
jgi:hypothetical protein